MTRFLILRVVGKTDKTQKNRFLISFIGSISSKKIRKTNIEKGEGDCTFKKEKRTLIEEFHTSIFAVYFRFT